MRRRRTKLLLTLLGLALALPACGKTAEPTATSAPTVTPTPKRAVTRTPGPTVAPTAEPDYRMVDVGEYALALYCTGVGTPTVILEAGWGDVGETWTLVQPDVAQHTRVCSYDRVGLGRSDPGPEPTTYREAVLDLHALLQNGNIEGPYMLVGHSLGGMYARLYTHLYPKEVVGLVLVDSSHPDSFERSAAILPPESPDDSESLRTYRDWFTNVTKDPTLTPDLLAPGSLGDLPLVVLTSPVKQRAEDLPIDISRQFDDIWVELQEELALLSSNSTHILVEGSGHFIQHDDPPLVVEAILGVLEEARE